MSTIKIDEIFHIVSARRGVPANKVRQEFENLRSVVHYVLGCCGTIIINGFGYFEACCNTNTVFYTRSIISDNTERSQKAVEHVIINPVLETLPQEFSNMVRLYHEVSDPLAISVFIEANRQIFFKNKTVAIPEIGVFVRKQIMDTENIFGYSSFNLPLYRREVERTKPKILLWVPRLVNMLRNML